MKNGVVEAADLDIVLKNYGHICTTNYVVSVAHD